MLSPGHRLGRFEILGLLGAGGMGEVYLARDPRLDREVALKILPEAVGSDPARRARFEAEARILATLSDPGIAAIYAIEESDGAPFLVLEYVRGETLRERLQRGPLPVAQALQLGRRVAEALEAAHARGIIHCDLKCANVMLTPAGDVKVLDFGLAHALVEEADLSDADAATASGAATGGVVAGTAAYMSPEQALGQPLDAQTNIWSFGCVLYEALSGRRAFGGRTSTEILAAVLNHDPDWSALPRATPEGARRLLRRCLQRDRERRLHDLADARIEIEDTLARAPARGRRFLVMAIGVAVPGGRRGGPGRPAASRRALAPRPAAPAGAGPPSARHQGQRPALGPDDPRAVTRRDTARLRRGPERQPPPL